MTLDRYTCLETVRRLDDYLDRELSAAERHEVERHLETCDRCLHRFRFEAAVVDQLRTKLRRVSVPNTLADRLRDALRSSGSDAPENT
jgi:anti-sigma factor (TIGR02949 family)